MKESSGLTLGGKPWKGQALGQSCPEHEAWAKSLTLGIHDYLVKEWYYALLRAGASAEGLAVAALSP